MNYKARKKERKMKNYILKIYNLFKNKNIYLDFSSKIILIGLLIIIISLFINWLNIGNISYNSFSNIGGNIGYIMLLPIVFLLFLIFGNKTQEKLSLASNINTKDHLIIIFTSIGIIIISIIYISFIKGLSIFFEEINFGKGIIFYLLGGIVILFGGILKRKNFYKNDYYSYINQIENNSKNIDNEGNMKLPF